MIENIIELKNISKKYEDHTVLDNLSLDKLFLGFFLMAGLLILIIMLAKNLYDYIFVYYFIKKSSKSGGANVMAEYYTDSVLKIEDEKLVELFDILENGKDLSLLGRLRLRYDILRLHNILHHRNRINSIVNLKRGGSCAFYFMRCLYGK